MATICLGPIGPQPRLRGAGAAQGWQGHSRGQCWSLRQDPAPQAAGRPPRDPRPVCHYRAALNTCPAAAPHTHWLPREPSARQTPTSSPKGSAAPAGTPSPSPLLPRPSFKTCGNTTSIQDLSWIPPLPARSRLLRKRPSTWPARMQAPEGQGGTPPPWGSGTPNSGVAPFPLPALSTITLRHLTCGTAPPAASPPTETAP